MSLSPGARLGPYTIIAPLGAGGMGEVYRAQDTRLNRSVAIKVLPAHLSQNPELRKRFEREARAISSLNHPQICTVHDIGHQDGVDFLVMEYLEGETLAARLQKGALPGDQALRIAIEIADGLDRAHRAGVVHRDLKPGNIMLVKSGAKLLDFGLAKLQEAESLAADAEGTAAPTRSVLQTQEGKVMGTVPYMAPEQVVGRGADARTDRFAFGAVLYEMVTGRRAFSEENEASLIGAILHSEPPPMSTLQPVASQPLERVVRRCLAKDPDDRWQSARDLMLELKWIVESGAELLPAETRIARPRRGERIAWAAGLLLFASVAAGLLWEASSVRQERAEARPVRLQILPPANTTLLRFSAEGGAVVSPDGRSVAFITGSDETDTRAIYVRALDSMTPRVIAGTEGAYSLFWSSDSRSLGFFAYRNNMDNKLRTVPAAGGPVTTLCDVPPWGHGGTWNRDGVILYGGWKAPIMRIASTGGVPAPVTQLDPAKKEGSHGLPRLLPDGKHFLYLAEPEGGDPASAVVFVACSMAAPRRSSSPARQPSPTRAGTCSSSGTAPFWRSRSTRIASGWPARRPPSSRTWMDRHSSCFDRFPPPIMEPWSIRRGRVVPATSSCGSTARAGRSGRSPTPWEPAPLGSLRTGSESPRRSPTPSRTRRTSGYSTWHGRRGRG